MKILIPEGFLKVPEGEEIEKPNKVPILAS
jgi:hypothetical protein